MWHLPWSVCAVQQSCPATETFSLSKVVRWGKTKTNKKNYQSSLCVHISWSSCCSSDYSNTHIHFPVDSPLEKTSPKQAATPICKPRLDPRMETCVQAPIPSRSAEASSATQMGDVVALLWANTTSRAPLLPWWPIQQIKRPIKLSVQYYSSQLRTVVIHLGCVWFSA